MKHEYNIETNTVNIGVRALCDFICRSGDIDNRFGRSYATAREGELTHRRVQDSTRGVYMAEVPLEYETVIDGTVYRISGRADGIIQGGGQDNTDIIEEIKTVTGTFYGGAANIPPAHIAQGVMYAFMWHKMNGITDGAVVRLTYAPRGSEDEPAGDIDDDYDGGNDTTKSAPRQRSFECQFSGDELAAEANRIISQYAVWARLYINKKINFPGEIKSLRFPYGGVRGGQTDFMAAVMRAARLRRRVMIEAPTGTGKTMAALYPSVKSIGAGFAERIFYLTAKTSTRIAAEDGAGMLLSQLPSATAVTITAKERLCPVGAAECTPSACPYAKGHYDRVGTALYELLRSCRCRHITGSIISACAKAYRVCPYELSLDAADFADIIICDYNYVFDPKVRLRRFFEKSEENEHADERFIFLCDEAHNLVNRAVDMYSCSVSLQETDRLIAAINKFAAEISTPDGKSDDNDNVDNDDDNNNDANTKDSDENKNVAAAAHYEDETVAEAAMSLLSLRREILRIKALCGESVNIDADGGETGYHISREPYRELAAAAAAASKKCGVLIRGGYFDADGKRSRFDEFCSQLADFNRLLPYFDKRHIAFTEIFGGDIKCLHLCLDPSAHCAESFARASSAVLFSATIQPPDYFQRVLGCVDNCDVLQLPSPYDEDNLCLCAADKISTKLPDRALTAGQIAEMIYAVARSRNGNYICYLPSYKYMTQIRDEFRARYRDIEIITQGKGMTEAEKEEFLSRFTPAPDVTRVGFCVLGGIFSEGVDLAGDRLSGVVIVGVGLPQITAQTNLLRDYYEGVCERGYEFAYMFPGMIKVLQAAGRVIRGESDRGVVLLIDERFAQPEYQALFPAHWRGLRYVGDVRSLRLVMRDFWCAEL